MDLKEFSVKDSSLGEYFDNEGYVLLNDLFSVKDIQNIYDDFYSITEELIKKYSLDTTEALPENRAYYLFSHNKQFRRNLYTLTQELRSIASLCSSEKLSEIFKIRNLKVPVIRNQALRIDFAQEPQFLQGIHQDVRGMRSANCLNFWIPLQDVNEQRGTLSIYPRSHNVGGIKPTSINESGYQIFTEKDFGDFQKLILDIPKGKCIMFHPYLFHGSIAATEKKLRLTVTLRFDDICDMDWLYKEEPVFSELDIQDKVGNI